MKRLVLAFLFCASSAFGQAKVPLLNWTASTTPGVSYSIFRGTAAGQESTTAIATGVATGCSGATCTYTDTTATTQGVTYYYTLKAVLGTASSVSSAEASVFIPIVVTVPASPTGFTVTITPAPAATTAP